MFPDKMPTEVQAVPFFPKMNDMISGDDTFLSAYMDGQLGSNQQQAVESALVASPELAENLRVLAAVRELVAGLPRDACADVSPEVMRRIRGLNRSRSPLSPWRAWVAPTGRIARVAGIFALAAGILLIVTVFISLRPRDHGLETASRNAIDNVIADSGSGMGAASTNELGAPAALNPGFSPSNPGTIHSVALEPRPLEVTRDDGAAVASDGHSAPADLELARRMLDSPAERRLFFIKNGASGKAQQQVASVVERTTRFGFFKITVSQGIVIDPRHPDQATVFALLVNPKELGRLRDQLKEVLPDMTDETPADPGIVTQLADIGQVQEFAPAAPADVTIFREALALRTRVTGAENAAQPALPSGEKAAALPTPEQEFSAPVAATVHPHSASEHGSAVTSPDDGSRGVTDSAIPARTQLSDPISERGIASSRPGPAAEAAGAAKADEKMVLVFVWVCQSRPS
jgi:anti-sigma factor RsiW